MIVDDSPQAGYSIVFYNEIAYDLPPAVYSLH